MEGVSGVVDDLSLLLKPLVQGVERNLDVTGEGFVE
jgi:hypothetical protein